MLGTLGTYTLSPADDTGLGQLRQRTYAAIVSGVNDDDSLDLHVFFPIVTTPTVQLRRFDDEGFYAETPTAEARATCQRCPVRDACLADATARDERWGLWGGLTPIQRRKLARMALA